MFYSNVFQKHVYIGAFFSLQCNRPFVLLMEAGSFTYAFENFNYNQLMFVYVYTLNKQKIPKKQYFGIKASMETYLSFVHCKLSKIATLLSDKAMHVR